MTRLLALAALLLASSLAAADRGWYIGGSVGRSDFGDCAAVSCDAKDTAYKVFLGHRVSPNLALEAAYVDFGKVTQSDALASVEVKPRGVSGQIVGTWPVIERLSVLGKLGVIYGDAKVSGGSGGARSNDRSTNAAWGVGAEYRFAPDFIVRVEWERFRFKIQGDKSDVDAVTLGFITNF